MVDIEQMLSSHILTNLPHHQFVIMLKFVNKTFKFTKYCECYLEISWKKTVKLENGGTKVLLLTDEIKYQLHLIMKQVKLEYFLEKKFY